MTAISSHSRFSAARTPAAINARASLAALRLPSAMTSRKSGVGAGYRFMMMEILESGIRSFWKSIMELFVLD